ncbi:MAG: methyltransferase domain-containing protein, partial [Acidimicrobiia bacterium]
MSGPPDLKQHRRGAEWALVVAAAQHLRLFDLLADGPREGAAVAAELGLDPRGTDTLLGALVDLGLVREEEAGFRLTGQGRARFVDRDTPDFEGDATRQWRTNIRRWVLGLEEAVSAGRPPENSSDASDAEASAADGEANAAGEEKEDQEAWLARFMAAMANKPPERVAAVAAVCRERLEETGFDPAATRVLDLGGGPGPFARAFARWGGSVVLADRPEVIDHVRRAYGLEAVPNLELWPGDFLEQLPPGPFDLVLVANITHIYDAPTNARLLRRIAAATVPGGIMA